MEPQTLQEFISWEANFPEAIIGQGLLYQGTKAIFYGKYKSLKSMLVQRLCLCIARGEDWLGFNTPCEGASVLYLQLELPHILLQRRMQGMIRREHLRLKRQLWIQTEHYLKLDTQEGWNKVTKWLDKLRPDVLVIDPIYKIISGSMIDEQPVRNFLDSVDKLIGIYGTAVILVGHNRKEALDDKPKVWGSDDLIGSTFFSAWPDSIVKVKREGDSLLLNFDVVRYAEEEITPVVVSFDRQSLSFSTKPEI